MPPDSERDAGETTSAKAARTRRRILDAAAEVLSVKGYAGTRLIDVAEHADLQAPAIYYYFPSRDALIEEVMWAGLADMREHLNERLAALPPDTGPLARLLAAVEAHLRHELTISDYTTAAIRNAGQVPEHIRHRQLEEESKYGQLWRELFRVAIDSGEVRHDLDPYVMRMFVMGLMNWAAEWWTPRAGSLGDIVRTAQAMVRSGIERPAD